MPALIDVFSGCIAHTSDPEISLMYHRNISNKNPTKSGVHLQPDGATGSHDRRLGMTEVSVLDLRYGRESRFRVLIITPN